MENKISVSIPEDVFQHAVKTLNDLQVLLKPYLIALSNDDRMHIVKMGDKTASFVEKSVDYASGKPTLTPAYLDVAEWKKDNAARRQLTELYRLCEQLCSNIDDTAMLCGSEALTAALTFYNNVKQAAKMNVPDAKPIYEDLAKRFPGRSISQKTTTT